MNLQLIKYGVVAVVLLSILGYFYYLRTTVQNLQNSNKTLTENVLTLTQATQTQQKTIENMRKDFKEIQIINTTFQKVIKEQTLYVQNLDKKFTETKTGEKRDIGSITAKKPGLMENVVNNATKEVFRCFEIISGSELKQGETNRECKGYISSN